MYWPLSRRPRRHDGYVLVDLCWLYGRCESLAYPPHPCSFRCTEHFPKLCIFMFICPFLDPSGLMVLGGSDDIRPDIMIPYRTPFLPAEARSVLMGHCWLNGRSLSFSFSLSLSLSPRVLKYTSHAGVPVSTCYSRGNHCQVPGGRIETLLQGRLTPCQGSSTALAGTRCCSRTFLASATAH